MHQISLSLQFSFVFLCVRLSLNLSHVIPQTPTSSHVPSVAFAVKSAQAQLNHINFWMVQVSEHVFFPSSQIWTSPVTSQSIKPNYPHYKDPQFILSNPFCFPRQHRLSLMQNNPRVVDSDLDLDSKNSAFTIQCATQVKWGMAARDG